MVHNLTLYNNYNLIYHSQKVKCWHTCINTTPLKRKLLHNHNSDADANTDANADNYAVSNTNNETCYPYWQQ